jgi:hypothetical protein
MDTARNFEGAVPVSLPSMEPLPRTMAAFIEGLKILQKYVTAHDTGFVGAGHDEVFFYVYVDQVPEDSVYGKRLRDLGFYVGIDEWVWGAA